MSSALFDQARAALAPRYRLDDTLGAGGMAVVFRGLDVSLERVVAIKVLPPHLATAVNVERFTREARRMAGLSDPHLVAVHDAGEADGLLYYVMDLIEADTLRERLEQGRLAESAALRVADGLLQALSVVHEHGLIHRDVKPENIFLLGDRPLLMDFGIAKSLQATSGEQLTVEGWGPGTPAYMAPEQAAGTAIGPQADLYAVGVVLYECLTGRIWLSAGQPSTADWSGVRASLRAVLERALDPRPERRWPDAQSFREALGLTGVRRWAFARRGRAMAAVVTVLTAGAIVLFGLLSGGSSADSLGSVAVRPCSSLAGGEDSSGLGAGFARLLQGRLHALGWRVSALGSAAGFPPDTDVRDIGASLAVDAVVTCEVQRDGQNVRLTVELADARTAATLMTEEFNEPWDRLMDVQARLATVVAERLGLDSRPGLASTAAEVDGRAMRAVVRGWGLFEERTEDATGSSLRLARDRYEEALGWDPTFGPALAGLAQLYVALPGRGLESPARAYANALLYADSAIALGWPSAAAHAARGEAFRAYFWDRWHEVEAAFRTSISREGSHEQAHVWYALWLASVGRHAEAEEQAREAVALGPTLTDLNTGLGVVLYMIGRPRDAAEHLTPTIDRRPQAWEARLWRAAGLIEEGQFTAAKEDLDSVRDGGPQFFGPALAAGYAAIGDGDEARRLLADPRRIGSPFWAAVAWELLDERERAFDYLRAAWDLETRDEFLHFVGTHHLLSELRDDPRYDAFVAEHPMPWLP